MSDKRDKMAVVGTFDGVHLGHTYLLNVLKEKAADSNLTPLVITFSSHPLETIRPERIPPLLSTLSKKTELINTFGINDIAVLDFDSRLRNMSALEFMTFLRDKYNVTELLLGYDTRFGSDRPEGCEPYAAIGKEIGMKVSQAQQFIEFGIPVCSSRIRNALKEGDIALANSLLGRPFSISGTVVHGKKLGRKIGFPTANISPENQRLLIPKTGVYAVNAILPDNTKVKAMLNIGYRPTVDTTETPALTLEAHLFDFDGDLYNQQITLEFIAPIREEKKFYGIEALQAQLKLDAEAAKKLLAGEKVPDA
ncbi:MAG: riboflavin biosynthesis protein RibF [Paramuribaculum sp.]|nr:riboflavin biosynthesis protein RibF [Paramuribaculum sp.]